MRNIKRLMFGFVAVGMFFTSGFSKQSDVEYDCKTEKNPSACIQIIYEKAGNKTRDDISKKSGRSYDKASATKKHIKIVKIKATNYKKAFQEAAKYCKNENGWIFSNKKANKINALACQQAAGIYLANIVITGPLKNNPKEWMDIDLLLKTLNTGCDIGSVQSCLMLFDVYHPRYYTPRRFLNVKDAIQKVVKPDAKKAIEYYRRGCGHEDGAKKVWHRTQLSLTNSVDEYNPKCVFDSKYLKD